MPIRDENKIHILKRKLKDMDSRSVQIGFFGRDFINMVANVNEFGANIKAKKGRYLSIPINRDARGRSPRDFNLQFVKKKNKNPILAKVKGKKVIPYFLLKKEVKIPERSFVRSSFDDRKDIRHVVRKSLRIFDAEVSVEKIFDRIGLGITAIIQKKIKSNIQPANSPITTEIKGGKTKTLVDTGRMGQSVTHRIT